MRIEYMRGFLALQIEFRCVNCIGVAEKGKKGIKGIKYILVDKNIHVW